MEEYGNGIYPKARQVLEEHGVTIEKHIATMVKKEDYSKYDYIICMDDQNYDTLVRLFDGDKDHKVHLLMSYTSSNETIEDPWYTDRFENAGGG
jgi:protein-tyrosine phosphatase